jgi:16S rRNA (adenine1518-N6/adenine1519-N6)-dimethyltransferase
MRDEENKDYFLKAKKSLGQHFLRSDKAINQIVENIQNKNQIIFEIGPGEGVLTQKLLGNGFKVVVIEIDSRSIEILEQKFAKEISDKKLFIINKDCLEVNYKEELLKLEPLLASPINKGGTQYTLIGNIPYYITGAIFRNTFEQDVLPTQAIFLVQKEVAERIVARDKKESILSISVKIFGESKIIDVVKAGSFVPPPKVDSAIIAVNNIINPFGVDASSAKATAAKQQIFFKTLRAAFSHKRKYFLSNLKTDLDENLLNKYGEKIKEYIKEKDRAEDIGLEIWRKIIEII